MSASASGVDQYPPEYVASMSGYDLTKHDSMASWMLTTNIVNLALVSVVVISRLIIRLFVVRTFTLDDGAFVTPV